MFRAWGVVSDICSVAKKYVWRQDNDHHHTKIDPLSTIVRLALLSYKPTGTKISIASHKISFQEVQPFQGAIRKINGDQRDDLHSLYHPIMCAGELLQDHPDLEFIFVTALKGLERLKIIYQDSPVIGQCLSLCYQALQENLDEEKEHHRSSDISLHRMEHVWTQNRIEILIRLFKELENPSDRDDIPVLLKVIDTFLVPIDSEVHRIASGAKTIA